MDILLLILLGAVFAFGAIWMHTLFAGFLAQTPEDYAEGRAGQFDVRTHLNGAIQCEGLIYGPTGRVSSRFVARFDAQWTGNVGVMKEVFDYDDGTQQNREWNLMIGSDGKIKARAADVVGEGTGHQSGDSVQLKYRIRLPDASGGHVLDTVDWMYLAPNGTIINRSQFRKFGIKVAELVATMRPIDEEIRRAA
ncbi:MAG: DUF3833 family protein [Aliishimia sp.]